MQDSLLEIRKLIMNAQYGKYANPNPTMTGKQYHEIYLELKADFDLAAKRLKDWENTRFKIID